MSDPLKPLSWQKHWFYFRLAIVFLTRIPLRLPEEVDEQDINHTSAYFGFVGLFIGCLLALFCWPLSYLLPIEVVVLIGMATSLMLTGAFHEDGLADTADGFGGGWTVEQKLAIMKDSRLGTYGATALIIALLLKYQLLVNLLSLGYLEFALALVTAHSLSRVAATSFIATLPYVQADKDSKTKPVAQQLSPHYARLSISCVISVLLIVWMGLNVSVVDFVVLIVCFAFAQLGLKRFFTAQLGGYTGDVLGAAQQIFELLTYSVLVAMLVAGP
jgi:adenosylcobinamide-GDP ribazoletransferase